MKFSVEFKGAVNNVRCEVGEDEIPMTNNGADEWSGEKDITPAKGAQFIMTISAPSFTDYKITVKVEAVTAVEDKGETDRDPFKKTYTMKGVVVV